MRGRMKRVAAVLAAVLMATVAGALVPVRARADIGSDKPAAILVFPKLLVDTSSGLDTMVRISNISDQAINILCYYINVTPTCSFPGGSCFPDLQACPVMLGDQLVFGNCKPQWQQTDFRIRLTRQQPTGWLVSDGAGFGCRIGVCANDGTTPCTANGQCSGVGNRCVLAPCLPLEGPPGRTGRDGQVNEGLVPVSPEDPFIGELECIALDDSGAPVARNDLIGEALIGRHDAKTGFVDVASYNAIGIPALDGKGNRDDTLVLGGPTGDNPANNPDDQACRANGTCAEYEACPGILILDHFFDGADDPLVRNLCIDSACSITGETCATNSDCESNFCDGTTNKCHVTGNTCGDDTDCQNVCEPSETCSLSGESCRADTDCTAPSYQVRVATDLTLIPCTQDFETNNLDLSKTVAQFLVFNEFEQRFSTSRTVNCFKETRLSNLDTVDNSRSIFSAGVAGTLTGQTRIRGVVDESRQGGGNALIGVAEEFRCGSAKYDFPACSFVKGSDLVSSTATNLHFQGRSRRSDFIYLPPH